MVKEKAVVVFSGGQDSATCLFWALQMFSDVLLVSFDYGQRNIDELKCAKKIADDLGLSHTVLDMKLLGQLSANAMTRNNIPIEINEEDNLPTTFVDGRNMLFLTFAAVFAKSHNARNIVTGVCETDFSGYPDCRDIFIKSLNVTLNLAMDYNFVVHTPIMWMDKADEWEFAHSLGKLEYIKDNTLTCYNNIIGDGCGECPSCKLRKKGYDIFMERRKI